MAPNGKRTFLTACGVAAGMLALGPLRAAPQPLAQQPVTPQSVTPQPVTPQPVTLLLGDALDAHGRQKPVPPSRRKLFEYLEQELNIAFEIKSYPWPRAERNARAGVGLIFGLPKTADRLRALHYSDVAANNTLWLVTRSDATFPFTTLDDLRGKTIGAVRGYTYGDEFERRRNKVFRVEDDIASRASRLQRLLLKRVDAVLLYQPAGQSAQEAEADIRAFIAPYLKEMNLPQELTLSVLPQPVQTDNSEHFAIARNADDGLIDRINAALARQRKHLAQR